MLHHLHIITYILLSISNTSYFQNEDKKQVTPVYKDWTQVSVLKYTNKKSKSQNVRLQDGQFRVVVYITAGALHIKEVVFATIISNIPELVELLLPYKAKAKNTSGM